MNASELAKILGYAAIAFDRELLPEVIPVYLDQLGQYDAQLVAHAVRRAVARGDRFPTVKNIRDEIRELKDKQRDPTVAINDYIARKAIESRNAGDELSMTLALIADLESRLSVKRLG